MDVLNYINKSVITKQSMLADSSIITLIETIANEIVVALRQNNKIITAGNGGSAGDAQHFVAEFISKFLKNRQSLSAVCLNTNVSSLTAISNDYGYEFSFSRQLEALGNKNDIFIAISTSGNSKNIINAINTAKKNNIKVVGLTGSNRSQMDDICDYLIKVPSDITPIIQEAHIMIIHILCGLVEDKFFVNEDNNAYRVECSGVKK